MSREIKFRAWAIKPKIMFEVTQLLWRAGKILRVFGAFDSNKSIGGHADLIDLDEALVLMQYTGLKDCNGVEIYEGDIVSVVSTLNSNLNRDAPVMWSNEDARFYIDCDHFVPDLSDISLELEVIGNIYENPEKIAT